MGCRSGERLSGVGALPGRDASAHLLAVWHWPKPQPALISRSAKAKIKLRQPGVAWVSAPSKVSIPRQHRVVYFLCLCLLQVRSCRTTKYKLFTGALDEP